MPVQILRHDSADFEGALVVLVSDDTVHPLRDTATSTPILVSVRSRTGGKVNFPFSSLPSSRAPSATASSRSSSPVISISLNLFDSLGIAKDVNSGDARRLTETSEVQLASLELCVKDTFVSKRDVWQFQLKLLGATVFQGHQPPAASWLNNRAEVVACDSLPVFEIAPGCGLVGSMTRLAFSSLSAQVMIFIQVSKDMFSYAPNGAPWYAHALEWLTETLATAGNHFFTIVLTWRTSEAGESQDFYEVVFEGFASRLDSPGLVAGLRTWFLSVFEGKSTESEISSASGLLIADTRKCFMKHAYKIFPGFPTIASLASARDGNVFEAFNVALDQFSLIHVDRKLRATGIQSLVVTASDGVWRADQGLVDLTKARVGLHAKNGVCTVVCLKSPGSIKAPAVWLSDGRVFECPFLTVSFPGVSYPEGQPSYVPSSTVIPIMEAINRLKMKSEIEGLSIYNAQAGERVSAAAVARHLSSDLGKSSPILADRGRTTSTTSSWKNQLGRITLLRLADYETQATLRQASTEDTWVVQAGRPSAFHELVGMRLSLDLQLLDRSDFGSSVSRALLRGKDIRSVVMRDSNAIWLLSVLDSGNVSVSKIVGGFPDDEETRLERTRSATHPAKPDPDPVSYEYWVRRHPIGWSVAVSTGSDLPPAMAKCESCEKISRSSFVRRRKAFHTAPDMAWNQLDNIVTDQDPLAPSVIPLDVPHSPHALTWRSRAAIKSNLYCLVPHDASHRGLMGNIGKASLTVGCDLFSVGSAARTVYEKFLAFLVKVEQETGIKLNVQLNRKPQVFNGVKVILQGREASGDLNDWLTIHHDDAFCPPRVFMLSIEWLMCHSKFVRRLTLALTIAAADHGFTFLSLPHALLFPPVAPPLFWSDESREICFERPPLTTRFSFRVPDFRSPGAFYHRLITRLTDSMHMFVISSVAVPTNPESEEIRVGSRIVTSTMYRRFPAWILMTHDGVSFVVIRQEKIDWQDNYTLDWLTSPIVARKYGEAQSAGAVHALQDLYFTEFRSFLHSTLIECSDL